MEYGKTKKIKGQEKDLNELRPGDYLFKPTFDNVIFHLITECTFNSDFCVKYTNGEFILSGKYKDFYYSYSQAIAKHIELREERLKELRDKKEILNSEIQKVDELIQEIESIDKLAYEKVCYQKGGNIEICKKIYTCQVISLNNTH